MFLSGRIFAISLFYISDERLNSGFADISSSSKLRYVGIVLFVLVVCAAQDLLPKERHRLAKKKAKWHGLARTQLAALLESRETHGSHGAMTHVNDDTERVHRRSQHIQSPSLLWMWN